MDRQPQADNMSWTTESGDREKRAASRMRGERSNPPHVPPLFFLMYSPHLERARGRERGNRRANWSASLVCRPEAPGKASPAAKAHSVK